MGMPGFLIGPDGAIPVAPTRRHGQDPATTRNTDCQTSSGSRVDQARGGATTTLPLRVPIAGETAQVGVLGLRTAEAAATMASDRV
jgi:hypothetical protein